MKKALDECHFFQRRIHPLGHEIAEICREKTEDGSIERAITSQPMKTHHCIHSGKVEKEGNDSCPYCYPPTTWSKCRFYEPQSQQ